MPGQEVAPDSRQNFAGTVAKASQGLIPPPFSIRVQKNFKRTFLKTINEKSPASERRAFRIKKS